MRPAPTFFDEDRLVANTAEHLSDLFELIDERDRNRRAEIIHQHLLRMAKKIVANNRLQT